MRSVLLAACCLMAIPAFAQVRIEPDPNSFIDPSAAPDAARLFERNGIFRVAGGVVLGGRMRFVAGDQGMARPVADSALHLTDDGRGGAVLEYAGAAYPVRMPAGLACPLARFAARDGVIAYTVPRFLDDPARRELIHLGIVHHRIAREFDGTPFENLLKAADFAQTAPLPAALGQSLITALNQANGVDTLIVLASDNGPELIGSVLNADVQVRYTGFLDPAHHTLQIGGVPLRYYWQYGASGTANVFSVEAFAQNWPANAALSAPDAAPRQIDVVNFYQVAGLFREMHLAGGAAFDRFTARVCASAS